MNCFIDPQVYSLKQNDQPSETGVFHSLRPACSDYKYSDIVSLTPAASCMAYEGLLKYIRENLSALDHGSFPFLLFVQRLLCTGFTDTNIPFTNITNGRIAQDPIVSLIQDEAMKEFYKASVTMWACKEHLIDKMPVVSPVPLLPFRFSFSSSSTPIPSSPRKKSSSTEIHSGSSRRHSILLDSLRQKYSKIEEMDRQNNPAKPRERVELTGTALKTLLSILNYLLFRFLNETDVSKRELGQMQLKTNYINHSTTTKANDVPRPNTSLSIPRHLLHLSELNGIDHDKLKRVYSSMFSPTTTTTNPQITTNNNLLALMAVRALEMLHLRACYDCFWEVALGSRCILSQLISKTGN